MLIALFLWSAPLGQDDELMRVAIYPGAWAAAVTSFSGKTINRRDIRAVGCVGLVNTDMVCGWEQQVDRKWRIYLSRADLSDVDAPRITKRLPVTANGN